MPKLTKEDQELYWENLSKELEENSRDREKKSMLDIVIPEGITKIPEYSFRGNRYIKSVVIPHSMKRISAYAFHTCTNLEKVELHDNIVAIGKHSFYATKISEINLSNKITIIGEYAFNFCLHLKKVILPQKLKKISNSCFGNSALEEVVLPENLEEISFSAFSGCANLKKINLEQLKSCVIFPNVFDYCISLSEDKDFVVVGGTLYNSAEIFASKTIKLPNCIKVIEGNSFHINEEMYGNFARELDHQPICTKIIVPESVVELKQSCFASSMFLKEIEFKCKLKRIPPWAFEGSKKLKKITIHKDTQIDPLAYNAYETLKDRKIEIIYWE